MNFIEKGFDSCCKGLHDALNVPKNSFFRIENNGVLYLTIGSTNTERGTGYFDQAVIFCPFCGKKIQDKSDIARVSK